MKKRMVVALAALLLLAAVAFPVAEARAEMRVSLGECEITASGRSVTFSGATTSSKTEDTIRVTITLWEQRDGVWHAISSTSKTKENAITVNKAKTVTVTGGYYYRATATHYIQTGSVSYTTYSNANPIWVSN